MNRIEALDEKQAGESSPKIHFVLTGKPRLADVMKWFSLGEKATEYKQLPTVESLRFLQIVRAVFAFFVQAKPPDDTRPRGEKRA